MNNAYQAGLLYELRAARYVRRLLVLYALWTLLYLPAWYGVLKGGAAWPPLRMLLVGWWQLWYLPGLALAAALVALVRDWPTPRLIAVMAGSFLAGVAIDVADCARRNEAVALTATLARAVRVANRSLTEIWDEVSGL